MPPRILVLQVRDHATPRVQERSCFRRSIGERGEVEFLNLTTHGALRWRDLESTDVLMIGGAGAYTATEIHDFTEPLASILRRWIAVERPFFGSCWGHHFLACALGGSVVTDAGTEEVGTFDIHLTDSAVGDPLLVGLPGVFKAQLGHHDRIDVLPAGGVELAYSRRCRNQMLRIRDLPVYSTQFHPEMTEADLRDRLGMYAESYVPEGHTEILAGIEASPIASDLIGRFLDLTR